jgi:hypothetical protein
MFMGWPRASTGALFNQTSKESKMKIVAKSLATLGLMTALVSAQSMEETVSKLGAAAGKKYMAPVVSGFGSNLNAGWYHKAPAAKKFGFHVEAGVVAMGTMLSGGDKTMTVTGGFRLDSAQSRDIANSSISSSTPGSAQLRDSLTAAIRRTDMNVTFTGETIIGPGEEDMTIQVVSQDVRMTKPGGGDTLISITPYTDSIPGATGILGDLPVLPLFAPQLTIGTVYGTNLTLRWLPEIETSEDIGTVKFFGFGIQHNPGVWLGSALPIDLSVGYFTQTLEVGTLFKASSHALGLNASKTVGFRFLNITPYGGVQFEKSTFDFSYPLIVDGEEIPIEFSMNGENKYRATAGLSIRLLAININADYNIGKYNSYSAGVMIGI